jgi:hypothetical protein
VRLAADARARSRSRRAACAPGTFKPEGGSQDCSLCPVGSVRSERGGASCEACPNGTAAIAEGMAACSMCPVGFYANDSKCIMCPLPPSRARIVPTCTEEQGSQLECSCSLYQCTENAFVSLHHLGCGAFLDVVLLEPDGEVGRALMLVLPVAVCALLLLLVSAVRLNSGATHARTLLTG